MSPSRLLLITPDFPPNHGGVAKYLRLLADHFNDRITVVTSVADSQREQTRYQVVEQELLAKTGWPKWLKTLAWLLQRKNKYDIVIVSHVLPFGTAAWMASWFTKKSFVVILHGMDVRLASRTWLKRALTKLILRHARVVVANSDALAGEAARTFRIASPITVYPCVEPFTTPPQVKERDGFIRLLTVSRLVQRKGHLHVLMALSRLKQSGLIGPFVYDIVGGGPMMESLRSLAQELHLSEVRFHGELPDKDRDTFFARADIFLMPVLNDPVDKEGFGLVFIEAAQYGIPSIGSKIEGVSEAVIHEKTGLLITPGNQDELTVAISSLANNEQMRKRLGQEAQTRANREFICQNQFAKLEPYL